MTIWYILPPLKSICLECPLSRCNENDPRCPWALAKAADDGPRRPTRELQVLAYLENYPNTWFRVCDVIVALAIPKGTITAVLLKLRREGRIGHVGRGRALRLRAIGEAV